MYCVWERIRENVGQKGRSGRWQKAQASFDFPRLIITVNDVDWALVVVPVTFLTASHLNIPIQPVPKDAGPQAKHLIEQIRIFVSIVLFDHDNHIANANCNSRRARKCQCVSCIRVRSEVEANYGTALTRGRFIKWLAI